MKYITLILGLIFIGFLMGKMDWNSPPRFIIFGMIRDEQRECEDNGYFFEISNITQDGFKFDCVNELGVIVKLK